MTELQFHPVEGEMHVGDLVTMTRKVDLRNWWQRRAPIWMGGKSYAPTNVVETLVITERHPPFLNMMPDHVFYDDGMSE